MFEGVCVDKSYVIVAVFTFHPPGSAAVFYCEQDCDSMFLFKVFAEFADCFFHDSWGDGKL